MKYFAILFLLIIAAQLNAQITIKGTVKEVIVHGSEKHSHPLSGANVYLSDKSAGTVADEKGNFEIQCYPKQDLYVIASFIGYTRDSIKIEQNRKKYDLILHEGDVIGEVEVIEHQKGEYISKINPIQTQIISSAGLQKLACCNLSESFENSATVDVSYSDAVTGAKQIQMLGLSGVYSQILTENIPSIRGLASPFGLGYIPGNWMQSIQISKGTSAVINGYESITGQINVEYKKPEHSEPFFFNIYGNDMGKIEANLNARYKINDKWSTGILLHGENYQSNIDNNNDGFLDLPKNSQINIMNRWSYEKEGTGHSQIGFKFLAENRNGGQLDNAENIQNGKQYLFDVQTKHYEAFAKNGIFFKNKPGRSIGVITSFNRHEQNSTFGDNIYNAQQNNLYANVIYQTIVKTTDHNISTGLSYNLDNISENLNDSLMGRTESVPGIFTQYTYSHDEKMSLIIGGRIDYHNLFGLFYTPRVHFKYTFPHNFTIRTSAGKGYRVANIIAENIGMLASSRKIIFLENEKPEIAWNGGISLSKEFKKKDKDYIILHADYYRTEFVSQLIADMDRDVNKVYIYNLDGKSYSNSTQFEVNFYPVEKLDITMAYRFNDVKMYLNGKYQQKPLVNIHKALINISYATKFDKWKFDFTGLMNGKSRLPDTHMNPAEYQLEEFSPVYFIIHAQITKRFRNWDFYLGGENLTNYVQKRLIIASEDPFGKYFDSSAVWGPVIGRMFYFGIRYKLES